ncbi:DUF2127 domain-containing protein [Spongisporangium articulatum]|uniref:DUF2127 domain-containing protein n=1 Tax=Spongisporangium articulatum TaxID=3362603 RepID=A0ABW8AS80_9ACTN
MTADSSTAALTPRPTTSHATAAVLNVVLATLTVITVLPELNKGQAGNDDGVPWGIVLLAFVLAILMFVSSYGVWARQRWGVVLTIVLNVLSFIFGAPGIIFGGSAFLVIGSIVGCVLNIAIVYLLLRRTPAQA